MLLFADGRDEVVLGLFLFDAPSIIFGVEFFLDLSEEMMLFTSLFFLEFLHPLLILIMFSFFNLGLLEWLVPWI